MIDPDRPGNVPRPHEALLPRPAPAFVIPCLARGGSLREPQKAAILTGGRYAGLDHERAALPRPSSPRVFNGVPWPMPAMVISLDHLAPAGVAPHLAHVSVDGFGPGEPGSTLCTPCPGREWNPHWTAPPWCRPTPARSKCGARVHCGATPPSGPAAAPPWTVRHGRACGRRPAGSSRHAMRKAGDDRAAGEHLRIGRQHRGRHGAPGGQAGDEDTPAIETMRCHHRVDHLRMESASPRSAPDVFRHETS